MAVSQLVTVIATVIQDYAIHLPYTSQSTNIVNDREWNEDSGGGKKEIGALFLLRGRKKTATPSSFSLLT